MQRYLLAGCLLLLPAAARAWVSPAPDVVVYTQRSLGAAMRDAGAGFLAARHVRVHVFVNSSDGLRGLISHGARADVVVADSGAVELLGPLVTAGSLVTLGRDPAVLVARREDAIARGDAALLAAAHVVVVTDPTTAASFDGRQALQAFAPKVVPVGVEDTPAVVFAVAHAHGRIGLVHASDLAGNGDVAVVAAPGAVAPLRIEAALLKGGQSGQAAAFLAFLRMPAAQDGLHADGLEVAP